MRRGTDLLPAQVVEIKIIDRLRRKRHSADGRRNIGEAVSIRDAATKTPALAILPPISCCAVVDAEPSVNLLDNFPSLAVLWLSVKLVKAQGLGRR
jgi:hypothetical protein